MGPSYLQNKRKNYLAPSVSGNKQMTLITRLAVKRPPHKQMVLSRTRPGSPKEESHPLEEGVAEVVAGHLGLREDGQARDLVEAPHAQVEKLLGSDGWHLPQRRLPEQTQGQHPQRPRPTAL